jgi:hypothetical protein
MDPQWYHGGVDGSYWAQFGGKFGSTKPSKKKEKPVFDEVEEAYTRYLVKDDGQEEGGFNLSDVRALRQSTEGWIISYTTMNDVDVKTGEPTRYALTGSQIYMRLRSQNATSVYCFSLTRHV